ncbi:hypothetical protein Lser_V15G10805 [Lactuca serriola]
MKNAPIIVTTYDASQSFSKLLIRTLAQLLLKAFYKHPVGFAYRKSTHILKLGGPRKIGFLGKSRIDLVSFLRNHEDADCHGVHADYGSESSKLIYLQILFGELLVYTNERCGIDCISALED